MEWVIIEKVLYEQDDNYGKLLSHPLSSQPSQNIQP